MIWILTSSGIEFDLVEPTVDMISLDDIAFSLSRIRRFNGHTLANCSVALHSVSVAEILKQLGCDENIQRYGLLHDAHEAYIGDISSPIKKLVRSSDLKESIRVVDNVIFKRFNVSRKLGASWVRWADLCSLQYEKSLYMPHTNTPWPCLANDNVQLIELDEFTSSFYNKQDPVEHHGLFLDKCHELNIK